MLFINNSTYSSGCRRILWISPAAPDGRFAWPLLWVEMPSATRDALNPGFWSSSAYDVCCWAILASIRNISWYVRIPISPRPHTIIAIIYGSKAATKKKKLLQILCLSGKFCFGLWQMFISGSSAEPAPDCQEANLQLKTGEAFIQLLWNFAIHFGHVTIWMDSSGHSHRPVPGPNHRISNHLCRLCGIPRLCHLAIHSKVDKNIPGSPHGALVTALGVYDTIFRSIWLCHNSRRKLYRLVKVRWFFHRHRHWRNDTPQERWYYWHPCISASPFVYCKPSGTFVADWNLG